MNNKKEVRQYTFTSNKGSKISVVFNNVFEIIPWINENIDSDLDWKMTCKKIEL